MIENFQLDDTFEGHARLYELLRSFNQGHPEATIRSIYQQAVQRGMEKKAAVGLCMHKILRIIYGMLKHNQAFDPEIDRKNRQKTPLRQRRVRQDKNRRYQDFDSKAPISSRQKRKRKERKQSQNVNNVECGISEASVPVNNLAN